MIIFMCEFCSAYLSYFNTQISMPIFQRFLIEKLTNNLQGYFRRQWTIHRYEPKDSRERIGFKFFLN